MCWGHLRAAPVRLAGQEPTSELPRGREGSPAGRGLGGSRSGPENQLECQQAAQCRGSPRFTEEGTLRLGTVYPSPPPPAWDSGEPVRGQRRPCGSLGEPGRGDRRPRKPSSGGEGKRCVERWLARRAGGGGGGEPGTDPQAEEGPGAWEPEIAFRRGLGMGGLVPEALGQLEGAARPHPGGLTTPPRGRAGSPPGRSQELRRKFWTQDPATVPSKL